MMRPPFPEAGMRRLRRVARVLLQLVFSAGLLALLLWWLEPAAVVAELGPLEAAWVVPALALALPQVWLSAWRWRLTAAALGLVLPPWLAFREYYLAVFLNQVLPGGVAGDLTRAWRHAGMVGRGRRPWHTVLIERVSGLVVLVAVVVISLFFAPVLVRGVIDSLSALVPGLCALQGGALELSVLAVVVGTMVAGGLVLYRVRSALLVLWRDTQQALLAPNVLPQQLLSSLGLTLSYIAAYFCCARAIGVDLPALELVPLIPLVLLAMSIPLSVAGWGIREGAAALVWLLAGLPPAQGVAISMAYGLAVFASSLPGALVVFDGSGPVRGRPIHSEPIHSEATRSGQGVTL